MPPHTHPPAAGKANFMTQTGSNIGDPGNAYGSMAETGSTGGGSGHNHGNTGNSSTASSWRPKGRNWTRQQRN